MTRKEHQCEFNPITNSTQTQFKMKMVIKKIKLNMGNLMWTKIKDDNKARIKRKYHRCESKHIAKATKSHVKWAK